MSRQKSLYPKGNLNDQRQVLMPESVSGTNGFDVAGKCPRPNKRHAMRNVDVAVEVKVKDSYSSARPKSGKIRGAMTYEAWKALNG
jgi:hypothetical protein